MSIDLTPLLNLGAVGVVLAWFLFRAERWFEKMNKSMTLLSRSVTLLAMQLNHGAAEREGKSILGDLDDMERGG